MEEDYCIEFCFSFDQFRGWIELVVGFAGKAIHGFKSPFFNPFSIIDHFQASDPYLVDTISVL